MQLVKQTDKAVRRRQIRSRRSIVQIQREQEQQRARSQARRNSKSADEKKMSRDRSRTVQSELRQKAKDAAANDSANFIPESEIESRAAANETQSRFQPFMSTEHQRRISDCASATYRTAPLACSVCDEWILSLPPIRAMTDSEFNALSVAEQRASANSILFPIKDIVKWKSQLNPPNDLADALRSCYCPHPAVTGMLLSPRGMMVLNAPSDVKASTEMNEKTFADINPDMVRFRVCADCYRTLQRGTTPRNAIANGHFMGELPASVPPIRSYSRIERVIVSPIVRFARVVVLSGGGQRSLSGHSVSYRLDVSKVANTLPLFVADSKIRVIVSNAYANEQKVRALKPYAVRREFVASVLRFFRANNHLYKNIAIDPVAIASLPTDDVPAEVIDSFDDSVPSVECAESITSSLGASTEPESTYRVRSAFHINGNEQSSQVDVTAAAFDTLLDNKSHSERINDSEAETTPSAAATAPAAAAAAAAAVTGSRPPEPGTDPTNKRQKTASSQQSRLFNVRASDSVMWEDRPFWVESTFPFQFPYGRGGPTEPRRVPVSFIAKIEHYCRLSTGVFQDGDFSMPIYDCIARRQMSKSVFLSARVSMKLDSGSGRSDAAVMESDELKVDRNSQSNGDNVRTSYGVFSIAELRAAADYNRLCGESIRSKRPIPVPPATVRKPALAFMKTAIGHLRQSEHTAQRAQAFRTHLFAMCQTFGPATWWLTLSTDDVTSVLIRQLAGGGNGLSSRDLPASGKRFRVLNDAPGAAALAFERLKNCVMRYIIGWDVVSNRPLRRVLNGFGANTGAGVDCGGLLGECRAWAFAVETQARGSLHLHIIVWTIDGAHLQERIRNMIRIDPPPISGSPDAELYTAAQSEMIKSFAELLYRSTTREITVDQSSYDKALACNFTYACTGRFEVRSLSITKQLRKRQFRSGAPRQPLRCSVCREKSSCEDVILRAVQIYRNSLGREEPIDITSPEAVAQLKWKWQRDGMGSTDNEFRSNLALLQVVTVVHSSDHRKTCFKKKDTPNVCRFRLPALTSPDSNVRLRYDNDIPLNIGSGAAGSGAMGSGAAISAAAASAAIGRGAEGSVAGSGGIGIRTGINSNASADANPAAATASAVSGAGPKPNRCSLIYRQLRRGPFMFVVSHNPYILAFTQSNCNLVLIRSDKVIYYITDYLTKTTWEELAANMACIHTLSTHNRYKKIKQSKAHSAARSESQQTAYGPDSSVPVPGVGSVIDFGRQSVGVANSFTDSKHLQPAAQSVPITGAVPTVPSAASFTASSGSAAFGASVSGAAPASGTERKSDADIAFDAGVSEMLSAIRGLTSPLAVAAQACSYWLLGGKTFDSSHVSSRIPVEQAIAHLSGSPIRVLIADGGVMTASTLDYVYRPQHELFNTMSWYLYCQRYQIVRGRIKSKSKTGTRTGGDRQNDDDAGDDNGNGNGSGSDDFERSQELESEAAANNDTESYPLDPRHSQALTHYVKRREQSAVVSLLGRRLPNERKLCDNQNDASIDADRLYFASRILVAFQPFRDSTAFDGLLRDPILVAAAESKEVRRASSVAARYYPYPASQLDHKHSVPPSPPPDSKLSVQSQSPVPPVAQPQPPPVTGSIRALHLSLWSYYLRHRNAIMELGEARMFIRNVQRWYDDDVIVDEEDVPIDSVDSIRAENDDRIALREDENDCEEGEFDAVEQIDSDRRAAAADEAAAKLARANKFLDGLLSRVAVDIPGVSANPSISSDAVRSATQLLNRHTNKTRSGEKSRDNGTGSNSDRDDSDDDDNGGGDSGNSNASSDDLLRESEFMRQIDDQPTSVIELIWNAARRADRHDTFLSGSGDPPPAPIDFPCIEAASRYWSLNREQHLAFVLIAGCILDSILGRINRNSLNPTALNYLQNTSLYLQRLYRRRSSDGMDDESDQSSASPLTSSSSVAAGAAAAVAVGSGSPSHSSIRASMQSAFALITGPAGSGKSRVIKCATDYARRWKSTRIIRVTATTGAAATRINAETYHTALGFGRSRGGNRAGRIDAERLKLKIEEFSGCNILIIDEMGMVGAAALYVISERLNVLRQRVGADAIPFGGLHIILLGDFLQLKPVCDSFLFAVPNVISVGTNAKTGNSAKQSVAAAAGSSSSAAAGAGAAATTIPPSRKRAIAAAAAGKSKSRNAAADERTACGSQLYREGLMSGVELNRNERAASDTVYADTLSRFAINCPRKPDIALVNTRVVTSQLQPPSDTVISVHTNTQRVVLNQWFTTQICNKQLRSVHGNNDSSLPDPTTWHQYGILRVDADIAFTVSKKRKRNSGGAASAAAASSAGAGACDDEQSTTEVMDDTKIVELRRMLNGTNNSRSPASTTGSDESSTDIITGELTIVIGGPLMVLRNVATACGIANGTMCCVVSIQLRNELAVRFELSDDPTVMGGGMFVTNASNVEALIVRYHDERWGNKQLFPTLPDGCFPLVPETRAVKKTFYGLKREFRATFLPCAVAYAITCHKLQGDTVRRILVAACDEKDSGASRYVSLSRVRELKDLYLYEPFSTDMRKYKPRTLIIEEMSRLRREVFEPTFQHMTELGIIPPE